MKKMISCALLFLSLAQFIFAGIGENFEPAGIAFRGSAGFSYMQFDVKENDYIINASLRPILGIMTVRNLEVSFLVGYTFSYFHYEFFADDPVRYMNGVSFGADMNYYFVKNPEASKGIVHSLGFNLSGVFNFYKDSDNAYGIICGPDYRMSFFVTERIAPYWKFNPSFGVMDVSDPSFYINMHLYCGVSFYFPRKMRVTHKNKQ